MDSVRLDVRCSDHSLEFLEVLTDFFSVVLRRRPSKQHLQFLELLLHFLGLYGRLQRPGQLGQHLGGQSGRRQYTEFRRKVEAFNFR